MTGPIEQAENDRANEIEATVEARIAEDRREGRGAE